MLVHSTHVTCADHRSVKAARCHRSLSHHPSGRDSSRPRSILLTWLACVSLLSPPFCFVTASSKNDCEYRSRRKEFTPGGQSGGGRRGVRKKKGGRPLVLLKRAPSILNFVERKPYFFFLLV